MHRLAFVQLSRYTPSPSRAPRSPASSPYGRGSSSLHARRDRSRATIAVCHSILTAASTTERYMHAKARPDDLAPP